MKEEIKVYIGESIDGVRPFPVLNRHFGKTKYTGKKPYRAIFDEMDFSFIMVVDDPQDAHFFLIPYNYFSIKNNVTYISQFAARAEKYKKQIFIFAFGDSDDDIRIPNAFVFRYAGYRYHGGENHKIIMPTQIYSGDILEDSMFQIREKKIIPTISFCGWAGFNSFRSKLKYLLSVFILNIRKYIFFDKHAEVRKQGIYWRKKAISALRKSVLIKTSFLVRNFYTANKNTIQGDPAELRKEYIKNITDSDFVLVVRGDANMAVRFYETLALGRIPVVIDTDWVLPLEDIINYKKFVVFVPYTDIKNTDKYIREFWDKLSNNEFRETQKMAREIFMKYLKFDSFLKYVFENMSKV